MDRPATSEIDPAADSVEASCENVEASDGESTEVPASPEVIDLLTRGVVDTYLNDLDDTVKQLEEFRRNQNVLIDTLQEENYKFSHSQEMLNCEELFHNMTMYHTKLANIKKEMTMLHEKAAKLKKRALKLKLYAQPSTTEDVSSSST